MSFDMTFAQSIISLPNMETERQRIAAITPFSAAQTEAIRVVRAWTRAYIVGKAIERNIIDLQDAVLNSTAEQAVIDSIRAAFGTFISEATAATTLAQLNTAWQNYRTAITA